MKKKFYLNYKKLTHVKVQKIVKKVKIHSKRSNFDQHIDLENKYIHTSMRFIFIKLKILLYEHYFDRSFTKRLKNYYESKYSAEITQNI